MSYIFDLYRRAGGAVYRDGEGCGRTQFIPTVLLAPHPVGGKTCGLQPSLNHEKKNDEIYRRSFFNTYLCVFLFNIISLCVYQRRVTNTNLYFIPLLFRTFIINFF